MDRLFEILSEKWDRLATWPRRMSIVTRLVVLLLVVLLIPLVITASLGMERTAAMMAENEYLRLRQESRALATRAERTLDDLEHVLEVLGKDPAVARSCAEHNGSDKEHPRARGAQIRMLLTNKEIDLLALANAKGEWIDFANAPPESVRGDEAAAAFARRALRGETVAVEREAGGIYFAVPVEDEGKKAVGALVLRMDEAVLRGLCEKSPHHQAMLLDENGTILAHAVSRRIGTRWNGHPERSGSPGIDIEHDKDGSRLNVARTQIHRTPWTVWVGQPQHTLDDAVAKLRRQQTAIALLAAAGVLVLAIFQAREITRPLRALRMAAIRVARGDLEAKAPILLHDEVGELAHTFNHMTDRLREHAKLRDHLRLAHDIQRRLLPEVPPRIPGLDLSGFNRPADETGGDYYDFVDLSEWAPDHLAVLVGDVTGHGVPAAILMATARAHIRAALCPPRNLAETMDDANRRLTHDTPPGRFLTLAVVLIDARLRRLRWSTAGHDGAMLYDAAKHRVGDLEGEDIPLGVDSGWRFHEHGGGTVPAGSVLVLGTDGVWETRNARNEAFGKERMREILCQSHAKDAAGIRQDLVTAVDAFRGPQVQEDDLTLVVVKFA